jgi:hypothetical protein
MMWGALSDEKSGQFLLGNASATFLKSEEKRQMQQRYF